MKKLVTAFAACALAGLVNAQVESVNIVGYQTVSAPAGFSLYTPTFVTVGCQTPEIDLASITGNFGDFDTIQFIDADGNVTAIYQWLTTAGFGVAEDGWYDGEFQPVVLPNLTQGMSYLLSTASPVGVLNAGEVNTAPVQITVGAGFSSVGNSSPTDRLLSEFTFAGGISDFDTIQFLDTDGNVETIYQWLTAAGFGVAEDGWYDGAFAPVDTTVHAGQGFLLSTAGGCTITVPSPI